MIVRADSFELVAAMPSASVTAVVTDPPYGLGFMGKHWDHQVPAAEFWRELLRVVVPGGCLFAFGGTRTWHRLAVSIEDGGWRLCDSIAWLRGQGMPKSLAVDKALDKQRFDRDQVLEVTRWIASQRDRAGLTNGDLDDAFGFRGMAGHWTSPNSQPEVPHLEHVPKLLEVLGVAQLPPRIAELLLELNGGPGEPGASWSQRRKVGEKLVTDLRSTPLHSDAQTHNPRATRSVDLTAPATELSKAWAGWGTTLRPVHEPIVWAMAPMDGTYAENARAHGVAGIHVDGARVGDREIVTKHTTWSGAPGWEGNASSGETTVHRGGHPGNVVLDDQVAEQLDELVGDRPTSELRPEHQVRGGFAGAASCYGTAAAGGSTHFPAGSGGPSRFYYCARASAAERSAGLEPGERNPHPTVKPVELLRWLVRLVRMPDDRALVLDPFMGSGTTGVACALEGVRFVGVELEGNYADVARRRIEHATDASVGAQTERSGTVLVRQPSLFE